MDRTSRVRANSTYSEKVNIANSAPQRSVISNTFSTWHNGNGRERMGMDSEKMECFPSQRTVSDKYIWQKVSTCQLNFWRMSYPLAFRETFFHESVLPEMIKSKKKLCKWTVLFLVFLLDLKTARGYDANFTFLHSFKNRNFCAS